VGGRDAPAGHCHSRYLTAVTDNTEQRTTADTKVCNTEPSTSSSNAVNGSIASGLRSEKSRFDDELDGRLCDWLMGQTTATWHDANVTTSVGCRRRCHQRRHQHVNTSTTLHQVSRTCTRRRAVVTVRRRCSVLVDRRQTLDNVTSGDDDMSESRLDRAFLADSRSDDVTTWKPDLSPIAGESVMPGRRAAAAKRERLDDGNENYHNFDNICQPTAASHCASSPLRLPTTTTFDVVRRAVCCCTVAL